MKAKIAVFLLPVFLAGLLACSSTGNPGGDGGGGQDGAADGSPSDGGADLPGDQTGGDNSGGGDVPICDRVELKATSMVNLLLVVDKSDSMNDPDSAAHPDRSKIEDLREALRILLESYGKRIRFGWLAFPNQDKCDPGVVSVPVGDDTAGLILELVDASIPWGGTPTGPSLQNAAAHQGLHDQNSSNYVLLVTDGMPTCPNGNGNYENEADNLLALEAVRALRADGIETFAIGLGEDLNASNPQLLNDMAEAGGHPRTGNVKYHPASSLDELTSAFDEIARTVFECSLALEVVPEKPEWIWVYFDDQPLHRDTTHQNGFDYDAQSNRIVFYGQACEKLQQGQVGEIKVEMGCAPPT